MTTPTLPLPRIATGRLRHVWSTGTDADTSAYDDVDYQTPPGIVIDGIGRSQVRAFGPPNTPTLEDVLPNTEGIYAPGGALGGFVGRGPATTFDMDWGSEIDVDATDVYVDDPVLLTDGVMTKRLFSGNITTAPQQIDRATANVQIHSLGSIRRLALQKPVIPLYEGITADVAVGIVLDACGWSASARAISVGSSTLLYFWSDGKTDGVTLLNQITGAEGVPACWYVDADDVLHWEGRSYRANATRSNTRQWSFFDGPAGVGDALVDDDTVFVDDFNYFVDGPTTILFHTVPAQWASNPDEVVKNVTATVNVRTLSSGAVKVWEYGSTVTLTPSQVLDIVITTSDPFKGAVTPVNGTDYTVSAGSLASVSISATSGQQITLRLIAGGSGATVLGVTSNGPQLRAQSLPVTTTTPVQATVDVVLSSARFEPKDYAIQLWPEVTRQQALDLANNFARRYQKPRDQMTIRVTNLDAIHTYVMLHLQISDRIQIVHTRAAIDANFYVESIGHDLSAGGGLHVMTLGCERVTDDIPSRYGEARYGFDTYSE